MPVGFDALEPNSEHAIRRAAPGDQIPAAETREPVVEVFEAPAVGVVDALEGAEERLVDHVGVLVGGRGVVGQLDRDVALPAEPVGLASGDRR
jgi:hypothetical protein